MSVTIKQITAKQYDVNGITVFKDNNNNWVPIEKLNHEELQVFNGMLKAIAINNITAEIAHIKTQLLQVFAKDGDLQIYYQDKLKNKQHDLKQLEA